MNEFSLLLGFEKRKSSHPSYALTEVSVSPIRADKRATSIAADEVRHFRIFTFTSCIILPANPPYLITFLLDRRFSARTEFSLFIK